MLDLPAGIAAHIDDPVYSAALLFEIQSTVPLYFTNYAQDLSWNGHTWLHSMPFQVGQIVTDAEGVQDVSVTVDEEDRQLQGYDQNAVLGSGTVMRIHEVWISIADGITVLDVMQDIAGGTMSGLDFDETDTTSSGTLSLGSSLAMTGQSGPRNEYDLSCQNGFGDLRCKVTPAQTTVALAMITTGFATAVTPAAMTGIVVGASLSVANADGTAQEIVTVTAVTGTTFSAIYTLEKTAAWTVLGLCLKTFANCTAYSNTPNFRGCRHALTPPATVPWGGEAAILTSRTGGGGYH